MSKSTDKLQKGLNILNEFCTKRKITLNTDKTTNVVFRKGDRLSDEYKLYYDGNKLEFAKQFIYLCAVFSSGKSFSKNQKALAGQSQRAVFSLMKLLNKFDNIHDMIFSIG